MGRAEGLVGPDIQMYVVAENELNRVATIFNKRNQ